MHNFFYENRRDYILMENFGEIFINGGVINLDKSTISELEEKLEEINMEEKNIKEHILRTIEQL